MGINGDPPPELSLPENELDAQFVRHHVRGITTSEGLFHTVLARLYRTHPPGHAGSEPQVLADAVRGVIKEKALKKYSNYTIAFTCETAGVVLSNGREIKYRTVKRVKQCPHCSSKSHPVSHLHLNGLVVVDGVKVSGKEWKTLKEGKALLMGDESRFLLG